LPEKRNAAGFVPAAVRIMTGLSPLLTGTAERGKPFPPSGQRERIGIISATRGSAWRIKTGATPRDKGARRESTAGKKHLPPLISAKNPYRNPHPLSEKHMPALISDKGALTGILIPS